MGEGKAGLTPAQRVWLRHLRKAAQRGETVRGYAAQHGLSEHTMYQAAKVLRAKGAFGAATRRQAKPAARAGAAARLRFVELKPTEPRGSVQPGSWRARLPNGVVIEGEGELGGAALEALGRL